MTSFSSPSPSPSFSSAAWPDLDERARDGAVLLVPVGATEQHGHHLPVTTDTDIAVAIADRAATGATHLVVAPALAYGSSGEHDGFTGTLSIGQAATEEVVVELGRSALGPFAGLVVVSAHGGNAEPLGRAVARLTAEGRQVVAWSPRWGGDLHAGHTETSLMLALHPDRVQLGRAAGGDTRPLTQLLPSLRSGGVRSVAANGVLGDPTGASAAHGRQLLDAAVDGLRETAERLVADARLRADRREG